MNEREFTLKAALLVWNGDPDIPHSHVFDLAQAFAAEARKRGLFDEPAHVPFPRGDVTFTASDTVHNNHALALAELEAERLRCKVTERVLTDERDEARAELAEVKDVLNDIRQRDEAPASETLERARDAAKALLREMAEFIRATPLPSEKAMLQKHRDGGWSTMRGMLLARAKEILND